MGQPGKPFGQCRVFRCTSPVAIRGFCLEHYDRHITPPKNRPRRRLLEFMQSVQRMLEVEYGLRFPRGLVPSTVAEVSKQEMRLRYKEVHRILDTYITKRVRASARREGFASFAEPALGLWEEVCVTIARELFGEVVVHPVLPNRQIPDIVPMLPGVRATRSPEGTVHVERAPLIVDAKYSMARFPDVVRDYGPYCDRLDVWVSVGSRGVSTGARRALSTRSGRSWPPSWKPGGRVDSLVSCDAFP